MAPLTLLDLPNELLLQLPLYMHNLEDFKNASSTCKRLRNVYADTLPKTILRLAARSAPTFFSPHPHFLVLAVARQIANWAVAIASETETRVARLVEAFRGGMIGMLSFALRDDIESVGLTMDDVRRMYEARFSVINPLEATIDAMIGRAWCAQPNFWNGGAEDAFTLSVDVSTATLQILVYGELFGPTMSAFLQPSDRKPGLDIDTRIEFIKYCIPDWACSHPAYRHDGFKVLPVGPYAKDPNKKALNGNQSALAHLVGGAMFRGMLWKRAWRRVLIAAGAEENADGKWPEEWVERLQEIEFRRRRDATSISGEAAAGEQDIIGEDDSIPTAAVIDHQDDAASDNEGNGEEVGEVQAEEVLGDEQEDDIIGEEEEGESDADADDDDDGDEDGESEDDDSDDQEEVVEDEFDWLYDSEPESEPTVDVKTTDWRFLLFWKALTQVGGLKTMEMVAQFKGREENQDVIMKPEWQAHIVHLRDQVLALKDEDEPGYKKFGKRSKLRVSEAPDLSAELYWCCAGVWNGL